MALVYVYLIARTLQKKNMQFRLWFCKRLMSLETSYTNTHLCFDPVSKHTRDLSCDILRRISHKACFVFNRQFFLNESVSLKMIRPQSLYFFEKVYVTF